MNKKESAEAKLKFESTYFLAKKRVPFKLVSQTVEPRTETWHYVR